MAFNEENNNAKEIVRVKGVLSYVLYPKPPLTLCSNSDNEFGITKWNITEVISGNIDTGTIKNFTLKGNFSFPLETGVVYTIVAVETPDDRYGMQYALKTIFEELDFNNVPNQKGFLKRFLSDNQIKEFYEIYDNPLAIIASKDMSKMLAVKGVGEKVAYSIFKRFEQHKDNSRVYIALDSYGLTTNLIDKLLNHYKNADKVINIVKNHPYDLVKDVSGIGFKTADLIALKSGMSPKSVDRIKAFILHTLEINAQEGSSYVYAVELIQFIYDEFGGKNAILDFFTDEQGEIVDNNINKAMTELSESNVIVKEEQQDKKYRRVYLKKYYNLELSISNHLKRLLSAPNHFKYDDWEEKIDAQESKQGWQFTEEQKNGIKLGLDKQVCFITGLGGCGKSSLVSGILACLKGYNFAQCSLSGKAAARLKEVTGEEGYTIHRLLKYNPIEGFLYNDTNPLPYDIVIVDEISLIGGEIFLELLKAISTGTKLIILGDMGQLESIGCMNLASDMYESPIIPKAELTIVHRQAQKSGIITASHAVRRSEQLVDNGFEGEQIIGEMKDMILHVANKEDIIDNTMQYFEKYYAECNNDIMQIQLISPVRERGENCVFNLNKRIQDFINPNIIGMKELIVKANTDKSFVIRVNDKVLCYKNTYKVNSTQGEEVDIFNGWTGLVKEIADNYLVVYFPLIDTNVMLSVAEAKDILALGYAITAHKCQGSSIHTVINILDFSTPPQMLTKELLYTMITRAEKICVLIGQERAIRKAIENSGISNKKTFLQELLLQD